MRRALMVLGLASLPLYAHIPRDHTDALAQARAYDAMRAVRIVTPSDAASLAAPTDQNVLGVDINGVSYVVVRRPPYLEKFALIQKRVRDGLSDDREWLETWFSFPDGGVAVEALRGARTGSYAPSMERITHIDFSARLAGVDELTNDILAAMSQGLVRQDLAFRQERFYAAATESGLLSPAFMAASTTPRSK